MKGNRYERNNSKATAAGNALLYESLLAGTPFWVAAGMATLLCATARFDDGCRWPQRLPRLVHLNGPLPFLSAGCELPLAGKPISARPLEISAGETVSAAQAIEGKT